MADAPKQPDIPSDPTPGPTPEQAPEPAPDHVTETRNALSRNVSVEMVANIGYLLTRFLIPPFVLAHVGLEAYGIWATAFILVSYLGVSTFGISVVFIKYVAEYSAKRQYERANGVLTAGTLFTTGLCLLMFGAVWLLWPQVLEWLKVSPDLQDEASSVVLIVVATFLASIAFTVFPDVLVGRQRIAIRKGIWVISYLVETLLIFLLVGFGRGIQGLAEAYLIRTVIDIALTAFMVYRTEHWFSLSPRSIDRESVRVILGFGGTVQLLGFMGIALNSIERALAAGLVGVKAAGLVDIAKKLPGMSATIPSVFSAAFVPAASYLHGGLENDPEGRKAVSKLYLKGGRYMNLAAAYPLAFLATMPQPVLDAWLGEHFPQAILIMVLFSISTQVHMLTGPGTSILKGIGRPHDEFFYMIPNIVLLLALVPLTYPIVGDWNLEAIVVAVVASTALAAMIFIRRANRLLGVSWRDYALRVLWPGVLPYLVGLAMMVPMAHLTDGLARIPLALVVLAAGALYSLIVLGVVMFVAFDRGERQWFQAVLSGYVQRFLPKRMRRGAGAE